MKDNKNTQALRKHIRKTIIESMSKQDKTILSEIFGFSQEEKDEKALKVKIQKVVDQINQIDSTYGFSHPSSVPMVVNFIQTKFPTFAELMPEELFDSKQHGIPFEHMLSNEDRLRYGQDSLSYKIPQNFTSLLSRGNNGLDITVESVKEGLLYLLTKEYEKYMSKIKM